MAGDTDTAPAEATPDEVPKQVEEPQNSLTQQFTEAEWAALKEFRVSIRIGDIRLEMTDDGIWFQARLPDVWKAAYGEEGPELMPINLWGIDVDPSNPTSDARVSVALMKFLRARYAVSACIFYCGAVYENK